MGTGDEPGVRVPEVLKVQPGGERVHEWTRAYDELRLALVQPRSRVLMHMAATTLAVVPP